MSQEISIRATLDYAAYITRAEALPHNNENGRLLISYFEFDEIDTNLTLNNKEDYCEQALYMTRNISKIVVSENKNAVGILYQYTHEITGLPKQLILIKRDLAAEQIAEIINDCKQKPFIDLAVINPSNRHAVMRENNIPLEIVLE